jgi:COX assembly mitochondrial protein 2
MHPPLDRPHPDCNEVIEELRTCHDNWKLKYTGGCNEIKVRLDKCLKEEKKRLLAEMDKDLPERRARQEDIIKTAFGKKETFSEYLQKDKDYQREMEKIRQQRAAESSAAKQ